MSNERPSLLDREPALPGLALDDLSEDEIAQGEGRAAHPCGEFSAARFHARYPERYAMIARALAEGFSLEAAARVFRIHERTAAAIREREARSLSAEAYRGIQARHARGVVLAATDEIARRLREAPGEIGVRDLVAAIRELHNVERALEGAPSQVVGVIRADGASAALADLLQRAADMAQDGFGSAKTAVREAEAVEIEAVEVPAIEASGKREIDLQSYPQCAQSPMFAGVSHVADTAEDSATDGRAMPTGGGAAALGEQSTTRSQGAGGGARETGGSF